MGRGKRVVFSIYGTMVLISILFISIPEASATSMPFTLEDENAEVTIDVGLISFLDEGTPGFPERGANTWVVDDVESLFQQWFWFRIGDVAKTGETSIDKLTLATPVTTDTDGDGKKDTLSVEYSDECITVKITWTLKGGPDGSDASTILETIVISNPCKSSIHFFQYSDFDLDTTSPIPLSGEELDDSLELINPVTFVQIDGPTTLSETVVTPTPDFHEVNTFPTIRDKLDSDGLNTTLDSSKSGPLLGVDGEWAFQWDIPTTDSTLTIVKCKRIGTIAGGITGNPGCEPVVDDGPVDNGGSGHEPPTIGMNLRGNNQVVPAKGIGIDGQFWTVTQDFHVDFELVEMLSSEHTISNTIFCSKGVNTCNHITLSAEPYFSDINSAIWKVSADKNDEGVLTVTKDDPDGYLGDTTCTSQVQAEKYWFTSCTIDFLKPMPGMMLGIQVWDTYGGVRNFYFNDGIEIIDTYGYPSVDTEFESSIDVPRLCLADNPDKRISCAFAKKVQIEIERAEKLLS